MESIKIVKDTAIGLYTVYVDGVVEYECMAPDEVAAVVNEIMVGDW